MKMAMLLVCHSINNLPLPRNSARGLCAFQRTVTHWGGGVFQRCHMEKYGKLTVINSAGLDKDGDRLVRCICECGKEKVVLEYNLKSGNTKTCGCSSKPRTFSEQVPFFWKLVEKRSSDECWVWIGCKVKDGYGRWRCDGKAILAHRYSYILHNGPIPDGLLVCHTCDNPSCCNPAHYFLGTKKDNNDDKERKGRSRHAEGEAHGNATTTEETIICIRQRHANGESLGSLGRYFKMSKSNVSAIVKRTAWKHVAELPPGPMQAREPSRFLAECGLSASV